MKYPALFFLFFLAAFAFCDFVQKDFASAGESEGLLILLNGTSSCGKTSILKELQKIYAEPWEFVIGDDFLDDYQKDHPVDKAVSHEMHKQHCLRAIFLHAHAIAKQGKNVFVDLGGFDDSYDRHCSEINCKKLIKILVYCPLDVIVKYVEKRNKAGDPKEKRPLYLPLNQFKAMYKLHEASHDIVVDRTQTEQIKAALSLIQKDINKLLKEDKNKIEKSYTLLVKPFEEQFKLNERQEIVLAPQHQWDFVVNTGSHSSAECAHKISQYLRYH